MNVSSAPPTGPSTPATAPRSPLTPGRSTLAPTFQPRFSAVQVSIHEGDQEHLIERLRRGDEVISLDSKVSFPLRRGDVVTISLGGGGGYGPPAERPAALIARDLEDGIITRRLVDSWAG